MADRRKGDALLLIKGVVRVGQRRGVYTCEHKTRRSQLLGSVRTRISAITDTVQYLCLSGLLRLHGRQKLLRVGLRESDNAIGVTHDDVSRLDDQAADGHLGVDLSRAVLERTDRKSTRLNSSH